MQAHQPQSGAVEANTRVKTVTRYGMTFSVLSSRERSVSIEGRHFFCAGRDCDGWTLFEKTHDLVRQGYSRLIGRKFERIESTQTLVDEIRRLLTTGEKLPTDVRPPWVIDKAHHDECMRAFAANRLKAAQHGETVVYHTLRWCGSVVRVFCFTTVADEYDGESTQRMDHHFDARDLPEQYRQAGHPVDWISAALADGYQLSQIQTFRDDMELAAQGGAA